MARDGARRGDGDARPRAAIDIKGKPVKRRSGFAPVIVGVETRKVSRHTSVDAFVFVKQRIAPPGISLAQLSQLFLICARYHSARVQLDEARRAAVDARDALRSAEAELLPSRDRAWRRAAVTVLKTADVLDAAATNLDGLPGLARLAGATRSAAAALVSLLRAYESETALDGWDAWRHAEAALALPSRALPPRRERQSDEPLYSRPMRRLGIRDVLSGEPTARDILLADTLDAESPFARGALCIEDIVRLARPWSAAAWRGWCCAGQDIAIGAAWDTWSILEPFALSTIAQARNTSVEAVKKSRQRTRLI